MGSAVTKHTYDPAIHHRRSIRLRGHDYAGRGVYFLTIRVAGHRPLFGTVVNGRMALNDAGRTAAACWRAIPDHFPHAALDEWIVMPDHVHGILRLDGGNGAGMDAGMACHAPAPAFGRPIAGALGTIIGAFKSAATRAIRAIPRTGTACRAPTWQRNYYDIIVRDHRALNNIRAYIRGNPANWNVHRYGKPRFFAGDRALLGMSMTAFLASRPGGDGAARVGDRVGGRGERFFAPARWPTQPECVVSGFLSAMERAVFDMCLDRNIPMVRIMARGLPDRFAARVQHAIDNGRLLAMSPFDPTVDGFSAARAAWCNQYALHLAKNVVIGQLNPDGMLACLLADLQNGKPMTFL